MDTPDLDVAAGAPSPEPVGAVVGEPPLVLVLLVELAEWWPPADCACSRGCVAFTGCAAGGL